MMVFWIGGALIFWALFVTLVTSFICFFRIFYSPRRKTEKEKRNEEFSIPEGEIYEEYREKMVAWIKQIRQMPHTNVSITSFDGLTLRGKYFEYEKNAPIELLFHGYRGSAERDLGGGVERCFALGHNVLIVDHRGSGESDGRVITFGINESRDCEAWIAFIEREIDAKASIFLGGVSMGAATVMIASGRELSPQVVGVVADCGYTSAKEIIKKVIREMKLPANLLYPFAKLGAKLFGRFDLEESSPIEAMKQCRLPILFFHGDSDAFVPFEMSRENYEACTAKKRLVTVEGAGHGLAYPKNSEQYLRELKNFFEFERKNT